METKKQPWMKHETPSGSNLIDDSCNHHEHSFMNYCADDSSQEYPVSMMTAALSSLPGASDAFCRALLEPTTAVATPSHSDLLFCEDEEDALSLPRFRQDMIHQDYYFYGGSTSLANSYDDLMDDVPAPPPPFLDGSSSSLSFVPFEFSESLVESQRRIFAELEMQESDEDGSPPPASSTSCTSTATREEILNESGSRVRILDQQRVYRAMDQGTASVLQCIGCRKHMMATNDSSLVFCPCCGTLTPKDLGSTSGTV